MTTAVPLIYSFPEFSGVAEAVADYIVASQNFALYGDYNKKLSINSNSNSTSDTNSILNKSLSLSAISNNSNNNNNNSNINNSISSQPLSQSQSQNITNQRINHINNNNNSSTTFTIGHSRENSLNGNNNNNNNNNINNNNNNNNSIPLQSQPPTTTSSSQQLDNNNINTNNNSTTNLSLSASRRKKKEENKRFRIGLSGGSLLTVLQEGLLKRNDIEWSKWDIYFADERLVEFESKESNIGKAKRKLFDKIPKSKGEPRIFPIDSNLLNDPQECADNYEKLLIKGFASKDSVKLPMFDLILLGCAPDGHVASLFPNQDSLREDYAWVVPVEDAPVGPSKRITLTVPVICHSHRVVFVVEGATKAPVIRDIMERPDKGLPASIINERAAGRIAWFVDDDALTDVMVTKRRYKFLVNTTNDSNI
ncbi:unnamed protein product [[Candida] boidinii]|uniref:Unnamed protein product n=1 Tax=Candida boidinii TaxID=5477 RepID=A0ACB5TSY8_CANBO|nr:unnamed protein product [[Candida] boidinii]